MSTVVDASVAIKWVLEEEGSDEARELVLEGHLQAPELLLLEAGNVLWAHTRRGLLDRARADNAFSVILATPIALTSIVDLSADARALAHGLDISVYDASYVALASRLNAALATGDRRLADATARSGLGIDIIRIGIP